MCEAFFLFVFRFWDLFHFKQNCTPILHVKRHDRKGIYNFPHMLLKSFMITTRVCLSHFEKTFITESEKKNIIESERFLIMFLLTYPILKYPFGKMKWFLVKGFHLNFVKQVKVGLPASKKVGFVCFKENPLKW